MGLHELEQGYLYFTYFTFKKCAVSFSKLNKIETFVTVRSKNNERFWP
jgi:hypothetical protein